MSDTQQRSLVKAITWRATGTLDTFLISWLITGQPLIAASISAIEVLTKIVLFWFHERVWNRVKWGRTESSESDK
jgi:uncharacterized membrane protein